MGVTDVPYIYIYMYIYIYYMDCEQPYHLCGARSGSPQLLSGLVFFNERAGQIEGCAHAYKV